LGWSSPSANSKVKESVENTSYLVSGGLAVLPVIGVQRVVRTSGIIVKFGGEVLGPGHVCVDRTATAVGSLRVVSNAAGVEPAAHEMWNESARYISKRLMRLYAASSPPWEREELADRYLRVAASKPHSVKENILARWRDALSCGWGRKKAGERRAFAKNESNPGGGGRTRPRVIGPMSALVSVELAGVADVGANLNAICDIAGSHIKHKSPAEVSELIWLRQLSEKVVTDFSAFEGSLGQDGRLLERLFIRSALLFHGERQMAALFWKVSGEPAFFKVGLQGVKLAHDRRCSGDYWTSLGNWLANAHLVFVSYRLRGHTEEAAFSSVFGAAGVDGECILEGDDGLTPPGVVRPDEVSRFGFNIGVSQRGRDADFLRRWHPLPPSQGGPVVNVLRVMRSMMWLRGPGLKDSKRRYLLRAAAWSAWCLAPGHPVITALVKLVGRMTAGACRFKGAERYYSRHWVDPPANSFEARGPLVVNEKLRGPLSEGRGVEVPPVPVAHQIQLERMIERSGGVLVLSRHFDTFPEFADMLESKHCVTEWSKPLPEQFSPLSRDATRFLSALRDPANFQHPVIRSS
jgi:hypothetical protein